MVVGIGRSGIRGEMGFRIKWAFGMETPTPRGRSGVTNRTQVTNYEERLCMGQCIVKGWADFMQLSREVGQVFLN